MWYFKFCVISSFYTINCEVKKFLFNFKKVNDCVIISIAAKERFYYKEIMTSKIRRQENKIFSLNISENKLLRWNLAIYISNDSVTKKEIFKIHHDNFF